MSFLFLLNFVLSKEIVLCQKVILPVFRKKRNEEIKKRFRKSAIFFNSILRDYTKTLLKKRRSFVKRSNFKEFDNKNSRNCSFLAVPLEEGFWSSKSGFFSKTNCSYLQMSSLDAITNLESTNSEKKFKETDIFFYSYIL